MRTLEEFQKEVLAPLREERNKKQDAALEIKTKAGAVFMKRKKDIMEKEVEFKAHQKACLKEFLGKQTLEKKSFFVLMDAERTDAHAQYQKAQYDSKTANRRANEEYMDKIGIAFAEYNKERVAAGEQPVSYDNRRGIAEERQPSAASPCPPLTPVPSDSIAG
jgi:hypothetical protein|nr:MAG TPA: hypothetical protein [Caudoviricetes sp.]